MYRLYATSISDVITVVPDQYPDARGHFSELFNTNDSMMSKMFPAGVHQISMSSSRPGVVRGLHFQLGPTPMAKLMMVVKGMARIFSVDLRRGSPTYRKASYMDIHEHMGIGIFAPGWCARGFVAIEPDTKILYFHDVAHDPGHAYTINPLDPTLALDWGLPTGIAPILSEKDAKGMSWAEWDALPISHTLPVYPPLFNLPNIAQRP